MCQKAREYGLDVTEVTRENYQIVSQHENFDFVFNCAMPSGRFAAKNFPDRDFEETVAKTFSIRTAFNGAKMIQISSISARLQLHTVYGRHKLSAEALLDPDASLIVRLGPLYHKTLVKGALIDIINNKTVYLSGHSKYAFTPLDWVCANIIKNMYKNGVIEMGAKGYVTLQDLAKVLGSKSGFEGEVDDQTFSDSEDDQPHANAVIDFAKEKMEGLSI